MKLGGLKDQQLIESNFSEELIFEKKPKISFKIGFFLAFVKNLINAFVFCLGIIKTCELDE